MNIYIAPIILIIIIIIYNTSLNEEYLYGFWVADDTFCEKSDISSMMIFIGTARWNWLTKTRTCYVIIMDDLCNQGFTITYRPSLFNLGTKYTIYADVKFDEENIWEDHVNIETDIYSGSMKIYRGDMMYAKLYKQHDTTNIAHNTKNIELVSG